METAGSGVETAQTLLFPLFFILNYRALPLPLPLPFDGVVSWVSMALRNYFDTYKP